MVADEMSVNDVVKHYVNCVLCYVLFGVMGKND